ncbi:MAG: 16S rRNA (guanine(527)-N(7))-methyltransferase RsmG [Clostridiales bacterium]|jgi:16S rRNA (guanine527-N7)-methyltransferase|nr:16S rRNA (guanine(527)-N(7))-methyltransferase RsmG [Clostridiales bacterium]
MMYPDIGSYAAGLGVPLDSRQLRQFEQYAGLLLEWNAKINLTAIVERREIALKHFADSLTVCSEIPGSSRVIDVGSGAGFPGVPVKIALPGIRLTLLDSRNKRVVFLRELVSRLELENVECVWSRAEESGRDQRYRQRFDVCLARAVADLPALVKYCLPFVRPGGKFIAMKGRNVSDEAERAAPAIAALGGRLGELRGLNFGGLERCLVIIHKL